MITNSLFDWRQVFFGGEGELSESHSKFIALANRYAAHSVSMMEVAAVTVMVGEDHDGEFKLGGTGVQGSQILLSLRDMHELGTIAETARKHTRRRIEDIKSELLKKAASLSPHELRGLQDGFAPHVPFEKAINGGRTWPKRPKIKREER